jgi:hypothetical protein
MSTTQLVLQLLDEAYEKRTWSGPNLRQSLRGVSATQAAWRPGAKRHNIWELTLHAAYWKYAVRRRLEGGKRGGFLLEGSNFFQRPKNEHRGEVAWAADRNLLDREHRALRTAVATALRAGRARKFLPLIYGICFHDVYHAGQIRLLRRLMQR